MSPALRPLATCLVLGMAMSLAGCATQKPYRQNTPGTTPVAGTDEAELWYAMERQETELARSPMRNRDPALTNTSTTWPARPRPAIARTCASTS